MKPLSKHADRDAKAAGTANSASGICGIRALMLAVVLLMSVAASGYCQSTDLVGGLVITADGKPVAGIPVTAQPDGADETARVPIVTQTDTSGKYRFENIPPGSYVFRAGPAGAISLRAIITTSFSVFDDIVLGISGGQASHIPPTPTISPILIGPAHVTVPVRSNSEVSIVMMPLAAAVRGRIAIPAGLSLPPLKTSLTGTAFQISTYADIHDDGTFEFPYIPPGSYELRVIPNLGIPPTKIVLADKDLTDITLGMRSTGVRVHGNVMPTDRSYFENKFPQWVYLMSQDAVSLQVGDSPVAVTVIADPLSSEIKALQPIPQIVGFDDAGTRLEPPVAPVGPDGRFEFLAVAPGTYILRTLPDMSIPNTIVKVGSDSDVSSLQAGLGIRVRGEVVPMNGGRLPPELITLTESAPKGQGISTAVRADGSFEFPKVGPGTYRILLDGKVRPLPSEVRIGDEEAIIRVEAPFKPLVTGRILFSGPAPKPDDIAGIRAGLMNGYPESAVMPDGSFELRSNEGEYDFFVSNLPEGYVVKSMRYGSDDLLNKPVKVDLSSPASEILVTLDYRPGTPQ